MTFKKTATAILCLSLLTACADGMEQMTAVMNGIIPSAGDCQNRSAKEAFDAGLNPAQATAKIKRECGSL